MKSSSVMKVGRGLLQAPDPSWTEMGSVLRYGLTVEVLVGQWTPQFGDTASSATAGSTNKPLSGPQTIEGRSTGTFANRWFSIGHRIIG